MAHLGLDRNFFRRTAFALCLGLTGLLAFACKMDNVVDESKKKITDYLRGRNIYQRGNLPDDVTTIEGYYDIIGGAIRHIDNEDRIGREFSPQVVEGDSISFMFDFRIFGGSFENSTTFYTNIEDVRSDVINTNIDFDALYWPLDPLKIKVGSDPKILKSIQAALISCRTYDEENLDELGDPRPSDVVRIYLTPEVAFGGKATYTVPAYSTLVIEVTDIRIVTPEL